jgi:hypothetical protein
MIIAYNEVEIPGIRSSDLATRKQRGIEGNNYTRQNIVSYNYLHNLQRFFMRKKIKPDQSDQGS